MLLEKEIKELKVTHNKEIGIIPAHCIKLIYNY